MANKQSKNPKRKASKVTLQEHLPAAVAEFEKFAEELQHRYGFLCAMVLADPKTHAREYVSVIPPTLLTYFLAEWLQVLPKMQDLGPVGDGGAAKYTQDALAPLEYNDHVVVTAGKYEGSRGVVDDFDEDANAIVALEGVDGFVHIAPAQLRRTTEEERAAL